VGITSQLHSKKINLLTLCRKPETCNSTLFSSMTTMKALTRKSQQSKCESGAVIYFKHPVDLELREKLSVVGCTACSHVQFF
jgi:hypothetical protein